MSHTATIKAIKIVSIVALRAALAELTKNGKRCELIENATPRAYYNNQQGLGQAPYVIRLADAKFDIGLYPSESGGYEARTDFWNGSVEKVLGVEACSATGKEQAKLGALFQMYGVHATMHEAKRKGYQCRRVKGKDGQEQVIISGVA